MVATMLKFHPFLGRDRFQGGNAMSILIKSDKAYYEVPEAVVKKYKITKKQFEKSRKKASAEVAGQDGAVYLGCCTKCSYASYWASC
jgi:hypothetical protein